jgi:hypothetical protein
MLKNNKLIDCANLRTPEKAFDDINNSHVYAFINKDTNKYYIGLTINPISRPASQIIIFILGLMDGNVYYHK